MDYKIGHSMEGNPFTLVKLALTLEILNNFLEDVVFNTIENYVF